MKNGMKPIALNALSSHLQGRKRFFSAARVFLPVTFVASTSPRLTFPILGHPVDEEERRALNAYRFPYTTYVTSFLPIYVLFHAHNGQSTISILPAPNFSRSWFPGLIRVNEQKCRFRKWRKHFGFCVWTLTPNLNSRQFLPLSYLFQWSLSFLLSQMRRIFMQQLFFHVLHVLQNFYSFNFVLFI